MTPDRLRLSQLHQFNPSIIARVKIDQDHLPQLEVYFPQMNTALNRMR